MRFAEGQDARLTFGSQRRFANHECSLQTFSFSVHPFAASLAQPARMKLCIQLYLYQTLSKKALLDWPMIMLSCRQSANTLPVYWPTQSAGVLTEIIKLIATAEGESLRIY